jgi:hypothetical protein
VQLSAAKETTGDAEADKFLRRPYRGPWEYPMV